MGESHYGKRVPWGGRIYCGGRGGKVIVEVRLCGGGRLKGTVWWWYKWSEVGGRW